MPLLSRTKPNSGSSPVSGHKIWLYKGLLVLEAVACAEETGSPAGKEGTFFQAHDFFFFDILCSAWQVLACVNGCNSHLTGWEVGGR